jgi:hypothetical protein
LETGYEIVNNRNCEKNMGKRCKDGTAGFYKRKYIQTALGVLNSNYAH